MTTGRINQVSHVCCLVRGVLGRSSTQSPSPTKPLHLACISQQDLTGLTKHTAYRSALSLPCSIIGNAPEWPDHQKSSHPSASLKPADQRVSQHPSRPDTLHALNTLQLPGHQPTLLDGSRLDFSWRSSRPADIQWAQQPRCRAAPSRTDSTSLRHCPRVTQPIPSYPLYTRSCGAISFHPNPQQDQSSLPPHPLNCSPSRISRKSLLPCESTAPRTSSTAA